MNTGLHNKFLVIIMTIVIVGFPILAWCVVIFQTQGLRYTTCDHNNHLIDDHGYDLERCEM